MAQSRRSIGTGSVPYCRINNIFSIPFANPATNADLRLWSLLSRVTLGNRDTKTPVDCETWLIASKAESLVDSFGSKLLNESLAFLTLAVMLMEKSSLYLLSTKYTGVARLIN